MKSCQNVEAVWSNHERCRDASFCGLHADSHVEDVEEINREHNDEANVLVKAIRSVCDKLFGYKLEPGGDEYERNLLGRWCTVEDGTGQRENHSDEALSRNNFSCDWICFWSTGDDNSTRGPITSTVNVHSNRTIRTTDRIAKKGTGKVHVAAAMIASNT
jgi:hypothetical protein